MTSDHVQISVSKNILFRTSPSTLAIVNRSRQQQKTTIRSFRSCSGSSRNVDCLFFACYYLSIFFWWLSADFNRRCESLSFSLLFHWQSVGLRTGAIVNVRHRFVTVGKRKKLSNAAAAAAVYARHSNLELTLKIQKYKNRIENILHTKRPTWRQQQTTGGRTEQIENMVSLVVVVGTNPTITTARWGKGGSTYSVCLSVSQLGALSFFFRFYNIYFNPFILFLFVVVVVVVAVAALVVIRRASGVWISPGPPRARSVQSTTHTARGVFVLSSFFFFFA